MPLHKPKVAQGAMGILVSTFQGAQSPAKYTSGNFLLQEYLASFGSSHYRMAATSC